MCYTLPYICMCTHIKTLRGIICENGVEFLEIMEFQDTDIWNNFQGLKKRDE